MARYEHLPIYKQALGATVHFEKVVAGIERYLSRLGALGRPVLLVTEQPGEQRRTPAMLFVWQG